MSAARTEFLHTLALQFPTLTQEKTAELVSENLLSNSVVKLPTDILTQAQGFVAAAFSLRQRDEYRSLLQPEMDKRNLRDPGNYSIAMSYDFHVNDEGQLKLIEINTNASFLALSEILYASRGMQRPVADFSYDELRRDLLEEIKLSGQKISSGVPHVLIVDEEPEKQRLYIEFLVYQALFQQWGWQTEIQDTRTPGLKANLIYNRDTDFFLEKPELRELRSNWLSGNVTLSPQPVEYLFLADKERQLEWNLAGFLEKTGISTAQIQTLRAHVPFATELNQQNAEELWSKRKTLFLKPKRSYGAKQSFRGASISNRAFQELIGQEILAQEFIPAPEIEIATPAGPQKMKYDLRFYAYQGRVQTAVARLYQGQVTNLRTPYGGFSPIHFS